MVKSRYSVGKTFISITNPQDSIKRIEKAIEDNLNTYICVSNPRTVVFAYKNKNYQNVMNNSYMNIPDAEPMIWAARLWGLKNVQRTMGPHLFRDMLANPKSGLNHFLLGDTDETLEKITDKFTNEYNSKIVGKFSPPFCNLNEYDYKKIAQKINESGADVVWLALRAPKQDFFSSNLLPYLNNKVCIGVGAAFRYCLGEYKVANPIIKKLGLMGLFWGKKDQKFLHFLWGYLTDNIPYLFIIATIPFKRIKGKKYYM
jgi:N-acetylglucosaminyldiphosphoundecaprenol N-acetyl-beta-D-mannosaminyltransferase